MMKIPTDIMPWGNPWDSNVNISSYSAKSSVASIPQFVLYQIKGLHGGPVFGVKSKQTEGWDLLLYSQTIFWWRQIGFSPLPHSHTTIQCFPRTPNGSLEFLQENSDSILFPRFDKVAFKDWDLTQSISRLLVNRGKALMFLDYKRGTMETRHAWEMCIWTMYVVTDNILWLNTDLQYTIRIIL